MIEPGHIVPMYGPLLAGERCGGETPGRETLTIDELAARLLQELGENAGSLRGVARVVARAHQLRCAGAAAHLLGRATATSGDDDLPVPAVGWWSMCAGPLGEHLEDPEELSAAG
jgi:hypothetical protein